MQTNHLVSLVFTSCGPISQSQWLEVDKFDMCIFSHVLRKRLQMPVSWMDTYKTEAWHFCYRVRLGLEFGTLIFLVVCIWFYTKWMVQVWVGVGLDSLVSMGWINVESYYLCHECFHFGVTTVCSFCTMCTLDFRQGPTFREWEINRGLNGAHMPRNLAVLSESQEGHLTEDQDHHPSLRQTCCRQTL